MCLFVERHSSPKLLNPCKRALSGPACILAAGLSCSAVGRGQGSETETYGDSIGCTLWLFNIAMRNLLKMVYLLTAW
jgi:hypothetical protein